MFLEGRRGPRAGFSQRVTIMKLLAGIGFLALGASLFGWTQQPPSHKVIIRPITSDGQPATDLTAKQLRIRLDGKELPITSLDLVTPDSSAGSPVLAATASPYTTNRRVANRTGREFVIAIDDDGIASRRDEPVRAAIVQLIEALHPHEFAGLTSLRNGGPVVLPTTDHKAVVDALPRFMSAASSKENVADLACRTRHMIGNLRSLLAGGPERTIIAFVAGMAPVTEETVRSSLIPNTAACEIRARDLTELTRVAVASAPETYVVVFPEGAASLPNKAIGEAGAESVAGAMQARLIRFTAGPEPVVGKILATAGTYYVATLTGTAAAAPRRADVRVDRSGIDAVARPYGRGSSSEVYERRGETRSPRDLIRAAESYTQLPLRAAGFVSRQDATTLRVVSVFEPDGANVELTGAVVGLFSESGELKAQWTGQGAELKARPVIAALNAEPGRYRMRVAVTDALGRAGTVDVATDLTLRRAGPVNLGSLMLLADQKSPRLVFGPGDANVLAFLHVYGVTPETRLEVTFQVWPAAQQAPAGSTPGYAMEVPNEADARLVYAGFPIGSLPPGDYRMLAAVTVGGARHATVDRTLRILAGDSPRKAELSSGFVAHSPNTPKLPLSRYGG